jgi:hypothetical protein
MCCLAWFPSLPEMIVILIVVVSLFGRRIASMVTGVAPKLPKERVKGFSTSKQSRTRFMNQLQVKHALLIVVCFSLAVIMLFEIGSFLNWF